MPRQTRIKIEKGEREYQKSVLSILPKCIALVPVLFIQTTRVKTIPSKSTNVSAARYLCIRLFSHHRTRMRSANIVAVELSSRRRFAEHPFVADRKTAEHSVPNGPRQPIGGAPRGADFAARWGATGLTTTRMAQGGAEPVSGIRYIPADSWRGTVPRQRAAISEMASSR